MLYVSGITGSPRKGAVLVKEVQRHIKVKKVSFRKLA